jgi:hypothetical protein
MSKKLQNAFVVVLFLSFLSCKKEISRDAQEDVTTIAAKSGANGHLQQTKTFSSDVVISWVNKQLDMMRSPAPGTGQASERCMAYAGITLYEAVVPGMPAYQSLSGQLTDFPKMPSTEPGKAYHWAASANAALAEINRRLFPNTPQVNKDAVNNLENSWNAIYAGEVNAATLDRSIAFGKEVATRVFAWAATDGVAAVASMPAYVAPPPTPDKPWLWVPTSPTAAIGPYTYLRRLLVPGVGEAAVLPNPPAYSTVAGSEFWNMVKDVYDKRNNATPDQLASAVYHGYPAYGPGGAFVGILSETFSIVKPTLDAAALGYAKIGIAQSDANTLLFVNKYKFNLVRPVTYINQHIDPEHDWATSIGTPNHPEYPSGHASVNSSVLAMFTHVFGENFQITLHTYDYVPLPSRSFSSFEEMSIEMSNSRVFSGLHYQFTANHSRVFGKKIAAHVLSTIKFLKE